MLTPTVSPLTPTEELEQMTVTMQAARKAIYVQAQQAVREAREELGHTHPLWSKLCDAAALLGAAADRI